jgi:hypothetical protein
MWQIEQEAVLTAGVLALMGLIVNVAVDLDNAYDMTTPAFWVLTLILIVAGVFTGEEPRLSHRSGHP